MTFAPDCPATHDADPVCGGCFLYERRGVCQTARDSYALANSPEAERRAGAFRAAVAAESRLPSVSELMQREGMPVLPAAKRLGLVRGSAAEVFEVVDQMQPVQPIEKEMFRVLPPGTK